jgi:HEPN domain-containing protein
MTAVEEARVLLALMERHVKALGGMGDALTFDDAVFGFHAQQAAELALKAWLTLRGTLYPRTHDLGALLYLLRQGGVDTAPLQDLIEFNAFAVQHRYDVMMDSGEPALDRARILRRVQSLRDRIVLLVRELPT